MIYTVTATAKTPLSFRAGRNNTDASTIDYIPGSALLGGLVTAHRTMRPDKTDELEALFFADSTRLGNLYPAKLPKVTDEALAMKLEMLNDPELPVYPFPRTAHSCKRFVGFHYDSPEKDKHHGMHDHLMSLALFEMSDHQTPELLRARRQCAFEDKRGVVCQEARSPQKQGYYRRGDTPEQWLSFEVKEMLRTYNGISRQRGAVQEGILFSRAVLAAESCFWGTIAVADDDRAATLRSFVEEASQSGMMRVGSNRSRGMGRVELRLSTIEPDTKADLAERLKTFNKKLAEAAAPDIPLKFPTYVPLTLTADAIFVDHLLRYQTCLTPAYLAEAHDLPEAELVYSNAATQRVMGWNSLYRLPKADELAVVKGSVFLLGFESAINDDLVEKLFKLQQSGVGLRRREGYGQLLVANPFHWEVDNV